MNGTNRKPDWLKVRYNAAEAAEVKDLLQDLNLNTVCRSANCPNLGTCYRRKTATFMILGRVCTRHCRFCAVPHAPSSVRLPAPDPDEGKRIAEAVRRLGLRHAVVTCVTRDDLPDGGAGAFADTIRAIRAGNPGVTVEVLISDLAGSAEALDTVLDAKPDVLNHNLETVPSLYPAVRPEADYDRSLRVLAHARERGAVVKTGIMLGLGETEEELTRVFGDAARAGVDIFVISQYLAPSARHLPVARYVTPEEFEAYGRAAREAGIRFAVSAPLARSSYSAAEALDALRNGKATL